MQGVFEHAPAFIQAFALSHDLWPFEYLSHIACLNPGVGGGVSAWHQENAPGLRRSCLHDQALSERSEGHFNLADM